MRSRCSILLCLLGACLKFQPTAQSIADIDGPLHSPPVVKLGEQLAIICSPLQLFGNLTFQATNNMIVSDTLLEKIKERVNVKKNTYNMEIDIHFSVHAIDLEGRDSPGNIYNVKYIPTTMGNWADSGLKWKKRRMECKFYGLYTCSMNVLFGPPQEGAYFYVKDFYVEYLNNTPALTLKFDADGKTALLTCVQSTRQKFVRLEFYYTKKDGLDYPMKGKISRKAWDYVKDAPCGGYTRQSITLASRFVWDKGAWTNKIFCWAKRPNLAYSKRPDLSYRFKDKKQIYLREKQRSNSVQIINCLYFNASCGRSPFAGFISSGSRGFGRESDGTEEREQTHNGNLTLWTGLVFIVISVVILIGTSFAKILYEKRNAGKG